MHVVIGCTHPECEHQLTRSIRYINDAGETPFYSPKPDDIQKQARLAGWQRIVYETPFMLYPTVEWYCPEHTVRPPGITPKDWEAYRTDWENDA